MTLVLSLEMKLKTRHEIILNFSGGPVLVIPWGKIAARAVFKSLGEDEIIKSAIRLIENRPEPSQQFSALIDCDDVCLRQVIWYSQHFRFKMVQ